MSNSAVCVRCKARLGAELACTSCGQTYPRLASASVLLPNPDAHVEHWRQQMGFIQRQGAETTRALRAQADDPTLLGSTSKRLRALADAVEDQVTDIARIIEPALGGALPPVEGVGLPRGAADYITCLFRDWAWSKGGDPENQRSLAAVQRVVAGRPLGRTLVLGAGGCRLAYDLHLHCGGAETTAVDVDPYLLLVAEAVIRGAEVRLTETSVNAPEPEPVGSRWTLAAPSGGLGPEAFHFCLADGTRPPFADRSFDTVVTPWFIDQVPADLPEFLGTVRRLLEPGGRWINHGPLIYRPDALPVARWYTKQEIFDLLVAAGFAPGACESASQPHFVSPLTGRGLIENVWTFEAVSR